MNWFPFTYILDNLITNSIHAWLTKDYRSSGMYIVIHLSSSLSRSYYPAQILFGVFLPSVTSTRQISSTISLPSITQDLTVLSLCLTFLSSRLLRWISSSCVSVVSSWRKACASYVFSLSQTLVLLRSSQSFLVHHRM